MSTLGQKQTYLTYLDDVRFTPKSGRKSTQAGMSAYG
jgi:hypothetical protein